MRRAVAVFGACVVLLPGLGACGGGESEATTDAPGGSSGAAGSSTGGAAGSSEGGTGGAADGGTGGTSSGGAGGTETGGSGASASGGSGGSGGMSGSSGAGGTGGVCDQADWEPNDTESSARPLPDTDDCDGNGGTIEGTLAPGDVDWFSFTAKDSLLCSVNPYLKLTTADNVTTCMFFQCESGTTEVTCPEGTQDWSSNPTHPGCCASITPMEPTVNCSGTLSETAKIWIQVSWLGNTDCRSYAIDYHY